MYRLNTSSSQNSFRHASESHEILNPQNLSKYNTHYAAAVSVFIVALIRFGPDGVSSPPADSSSLCAADADFRFFLRAFAVVGDGDGSSNVVLSGMTFFTHKRIFIAREYL